jgi:soluble lytic murein transglycosylase-like protein
MDTKIDRNPSLPPIYGKQETGKNVANQSTSSFQDMVEEKMNEIGRSQVAYNQYLSKGRTDLAAGAHHWAEYQRQALHQLGVSEESYKEGVDLSSRFLEKNGQIPAGIYDPSKLGQTYRSDYKQWAAKVGVNVASPSIPAPKQGQAHLLGKTLQSAPKAVQGWIQKAAKSAGVDPNLLAAIAKQESGFNQNEYSSEGAIGLFQLMPSTAQSLGVNPHDPYENTLGGAKYIKDKLNKYNDVKLALAAYNAGPGRVDQVIRHVGSRDWKSIESHLPKQTQGFVRKVLSYYG